MLNSAASSWQDKKGEKRIRGNMGDGKKEKKRREKTGRRRARINAKISAGQGGEAGGKNMRREGLYLYYQSLHGDWLCLTCIIGISRY